MVMFFTLQLAAQAINPGDLTGKWKLTKVVEEQVQGGVVLSTKEYTPDRYTGDIPFREVECFADQRVAYGSSSNEELRAGGNYQLYGDNSQIVFHGKHTGFRFEFFWNGDSRQAFSLTQKINLQQGTQKVRNIRFYYSKFN